MKYYEQLLKLEVFNLKDVELLVGSSNAAKQLLDRYVKKGFVKKIKKNLYYCVNLENKNSNANRFIIGSNINPTTYISHHTAFEFHGLAHQTFFEVYAASEKIFGNFGFEDITYKYVKTNFRNGVEVPETNSKIRVTNVERTVIDSINNVYLAGGAEELFQCLGSVLSLDNDRLSEYLGHYGKQFLYQKAGYILERNKMEFGIWDDLINSCLQKVGEGIRYFDKDAQGGNGVYVKKWNLIIPKDLNNALNQGVTEFI